MLARQCYCCYCCFVDVVVIVVMVALVGDLGVVVIVRNFSRNVPQSCEGTLSRVDMCCLHNGVQVCL